MTTMIIIAAIIIALVIICFIVITAIEEHKDEKIEKQIDEIRKKGDKR